jgi:sugar lactone lactonase YvrE
VSQRCTFNDRLVELRRHFGIRPVCASAALLVLGLLLINDVTGWAAEAAMPSHPDFADRIIKRLRFSDDEKTGRVIAATTEYLNALDTILKERTVTLDRLAAETGTGAKPDQAQVAAAYEKARIKYWPLRDAYVRKLEADLTPRLVERVKDGLTHDTLHRLEAMYYEMIPDLKPEEKAHIQGLLVEARENAMLAISAKGQKQWFDKYRGIINNYIASQGHDFTGLSKAWDSAHAHVHQLVKKWETEPMLKVPESVLFVPGESFLYVSNVDGPQPWAKDGKGSIGKVALDGKIIAVDWVTGLDAPKGMGLYGGQLYVADMDRVVVIDVTKAAITKTIAIEGAKMLNDITIDTKGVVYVSDSATGKVHAIRDGKASVFLEDLKGPNGLLAHGDKFYVLHDNGLHELEDGKKLRLITAGMDGGVDGVEKLPNGDLIVSCWRGVIHYVKPDGQRQTLLDTRTNEVFSADIGLDAASRTVYVPTFFKNTVAAYEVK